MLASPPDRSLNPPVLRMNTSPPFYAPGVPGGIQPARLEAPPQPTEGNMTTIYVVKTGEQFLCCAEDGDIGMAPVIEGAKSFLSYEEAEKAAHEHADPGYEIVSFSVTRH